MTKFEKARAVGNLWEKGDICRVYFAADRFGLKGTELSKTQAGLLSSTKFYIDEKQPDHIYTKLAHKVWDRYVDTVIENIEAALV